MKGSLPSTGGEVPSASDDETGRFARTFGPDRQRAPLRRSEFTWLLGFVLVLAAVILVASAWFAYQRSLPATGPFAMRRSPDLTVDQLRSRNKEAAPFVAFSSLPLLVAGVWMLRRRPSKSGAQAAAVVATLVFGLALMIMSVVV